VRHRAPLTGASAGSRIARMPHATPSPHRARLPLLVLALALATGAALYGLQHLKRELAGPPSHARSLAVGPGEAGPDRAAP